MSRALGRQQGREVGQLGTARRRLCARGEGGGAAHAGCAHAPCGPVSAHGGPGRWGVVPGNATGHREAGAWRELPHGGHGSRRELRRHLDVATARMGSRHRGGAWGGTISGGAPQGARVTGKASHQQVGAPDACVRPQPRPGRGTLASRQSSGAAPSSALCVLQKCTTFQKSAPLRPGSLDPQQGCAQDHMTLGLRLPAMQSLQTADRTQPPCPCLPGSPSWEPLCPLQGGLAPAEPLCATEGPRGSVPLAPGEGPGAASRTSCSCSSVWGGGAGAAGRGFWHRR